MSLRGVLFVKVPLAIHFGFVRFSVRTLYFNKRLAVRNPAVVFSVLALCSAFCSFRNHTVVRHLRVYLTAF